MAVVSEDVQSLSYYNPLHALLHGYVWPFLIIYLLETYAWVVVYGVSDYFEAGCIVIAATAAVQVVTCLFCVWSVHVRCLLTCSKASSVQQATMVKVTPTANNGFTELVPLHKEKDGGQEVIWFVFQKVKYYYDSEEKKQFNAVQFPVHHSYSHYSKWKGLQSEQEVKAASKRFGANRLDISAPDFLALFTERATAPFFVFQVFCVLLWCLDEYWYYSIFTLIMLILFEALLVKQQQRNLTQIRKMGSKPHKVQVFRENKWKYIMSDELLPGDLISIGRPKDDDLVPCDMMLLRGSCIVDEAMLTGESVPQMKEPLDNVTDLSQVLDIQDSSSKLHIISGGTRVVQHSSPDKSTMKPSDGGCVCYVLRTGFNTSQGKLLRTILFSVKRASANNLEAFVFILFLLIFAIAASSYVWIKGTEDPNRNRYKLFLECTLILTSVVPPELPIELSLAVNASLVTLARLGIYCTEPFRIPFAGKIDICCFDKTGTLTSDNLIVEGIAGLDSKEGAKLEATEKAPIETQQVLGCCHSLLLLDDDLVGDPLEKAALTTLDWELTKNDCVHSRRGKKLSIKILHRFHFSSALKRMATVCNILSGTGGAQHIAVVKGAAEVIKPMLTEVPLMFDEVYTTLSRQGARVLALGHKKLGSLSLRELHELSREDVECNLKFAGFVVFSCPLKADSRMNIKKLLAASHHVVMITGDNPLTACHVAKDLKIITKQALILANEGNTWCWQSVSDGAWHPMDSGVASIKHLLNDYNLCLTGEGMDYLRSVYGGDQFKTILAHVKVFARVSPKQKEHVVITLRNLGYHTLMCGDGTNDVGALKHAHVGMALLSSSVIAELDKRKALHDLKTGRLTPSSSPSSGESLQRRPLRSTPSKTPPGKPASPAKPLSPEELKQQQIKKLMKELDEASNLDQPKVVKLGDASIASPFTSRHSSIECICHVIRQGRCTLVTTLQMFKILAINALIIAYSQSVLYLEGIKFSDTQATIQGILLATCFLFISHSKPLDKLSRERPLTNIFNIYTVLTVVCQFVIHFSCLLYLVGEATKMSPPNEEEFVDLEKKFEQNVLNSTVYLISMTMQISNVAVNYRGHPFMASLRENRPLCFSLLGAVSVVFLLASGLMPDLAEYLEVVEFPSEFQHRLVAVLAADLSLSYLVDQLLLRICGSGKLRTTQ